MITASSVEDLKLVSEKSTTSLSYLRYFIYGMLLPLSFAPFHLPGFAIISLAFFYYSLCKNKDSSFLKGLFFGLGFFGLGVSWIFISINEYGHLNWFISALMTLLFLLYLSLFPALTATVFTRLSGKFTPLRSGGLFSALWIISEYSRATLFSGFPWLLTGYGQFDSPLKNLLPIIGVYGTGFMTCLAATLAVHSLKSEGMRKYLYLSLFLAILLGPGLLNDKKWAVEESRPLSVGIIQANLSMRNKWDETLFWQLLSRYQRDTTALLGTEVIVMPESAIPLPATYISEFLQNLQQAATRANSAILLGIPQPATLDESSYFNSLLSLGKAEGSYLKQHLVPFGEYIPAVFQKIINWLEIPDANLRPGKQNQTLVQVHKNPIAALICYELAYGDLLRKQLPLAKWIVSISDDGWFGHSLAMYQQQQIAQVRSLQAARYQVVSNNDGLSSVIDTRGKIIASLPAFSSDTLKASLFPASGETPWVRFGDFPALLFSALTILFCLSGKRFFQ